MLEVREVDSGCTGGADSAPRFEKGRSKLVPVVPVNAGAAEGIVPQQRGAAEGVVDERVGLVGGPVGGRAGARDTFDPLFGGELVLTITCEEWQFGKFRLTEKFDIGVDVGHDNEVVEVASGGGDEWFGRITLKR